MARWMSKISDLNPDTFLKLQRSRLILEAVVKKVELNKISSFFARNTTHNLDYFFFYSAHMMCKNWSHLIFPLSLAVILPDTSILLITEWFRDGLKDSRRRGGGGWPSKISNFHTTQSN